MRNLVKILFMGVSFFIYFSVFEFALEKFLPVSLSIEFIVGVLIAVAVSFVLSLFSSDKLMDVVEGR
ncbi:hypothetical protein IRB23M11_22160 [Alkalibacterium sp. m-11]|uniref:Uncharacterized protein n=1 Tax=Alkalibacterium indicireducens TaxID=398758 RepID=A0ABN1B6B5_9LACT